MWDVYRRLLSRKWFTHADVMADRLGLISANELPYSISKCPNNGELRKAFRNVYKLVEEKPDTTALNLVEIIGSKSFFMLAQMIILLRICRMLRPSKIFGLMHSSARTPQDNGLNTSSKIHLIYFKSLEEERMESR